MNLGVALECDQLSATCCFVPVCGGAAGGGWGRDSHRLCVLLLGLFAQAAAVITGHPVDGFGKVAEQVPPIGYLDRVRCAEPGALKW